ncbi:hypothetical protein CFP71_13590 [Amycolatopsis thailandensis]|uniref:Uncharacterized protein n=1 Tax=Amycolatopsis thailandensis TaxID=589330 RepID=A0A229SC01_9PSEU|nr:hypothetical protein CFP71_13590 [Amycolatopsis thailandensis]
MSRGCDLDCGPPSTQRWAARNRDAPQAQPVHNSEESTSASREADNRVDRSDTLPLGESFGTALVTSWDFARTPYEIVAPHVAETITLHPYVYADPARIERLIVVKFDDVLRRDPIHDGYSTEWTAVH